jgi:hypothetical protein
VPSQMPQTGRIFDLERQNSDGLACPLNLYRPYQVKIIDKTIIDRGLALFLLIS